MPCSRWARSTSASAASIAKQIEAQAQPGQDRGPADRGQPAAVGASATAPAWSSRSKADMVLKHIEFVRLDAQTAMAVLVGEDGQVENRIVHAAARADRERPDAGQQLPRAPRRRPDADRGARRRWRPARRAAGRARRTDRRSWSKPGLATLSDTARQRPPTVIVRGRANLINDTMASDDLERMRQLFDELESKDGLIELLGDAEKAQGVQASSSARKTSCSRCRGPR